MDHSCRVKCRASVCLSAATKPATGLVPRTSGKQMMQLFRMNVCQRLSASTSATEIRQRAVAASSMPAALPVMSSEASRHAASFFDCAPPER
jgi:hypothetical protein